MILLRYIISYILAKTRKWYCFHVLTNINLFLVCMLHVLMALLTIMWAGNAQSCLNQNWHQAQINFRHVLKQISLFSSIFTILNIPGLCILTNLYLFYYFYVLTLYSYKFLILLLLLCIYKAVSVSKHAVHFTAYLQNHKFIAQNCCKIENRKND